MENKGFDLTGEIIRIVTIVSSNNFTFFKTNYTIVKFIFPEGWLNSRIF